MASFSLTFPTRNITAARYFIIPASCRCCSSRPALQRSTEKNIEIGYAIKGQSLRSLFFVRRWTANFPRQTLRKLSDFGRFNFSVSCDSANNELPIDEKKDRYSIVSFYNLADFSTVLDEVEAHRDFLSSKDIRGRIYIASTGINGQFSGPKEDCDSYIAWLKSDIRYSDANFTETLHSEHVFPRLKVAPKRHLVASFDDHVDLKNRGKHVTPAQWKETLDKVDEDYIVLDVRNDYEWKIGHFEGKRPGSTYLPNCKTFREFSQYADDLKTKIDPKKTKVMMSCTGGIRCELYSAYLRDKGFEEVYQLKGGMLGYGREQGNTHWKGQLFVFDDRLVVPLDQGKGETDTSATEAPVGVCSRCGAPGVFRLWNCANVDCNQLFIACDSCVDAAHGCCSESCTSAPRVRPHIFQRHTGKPYRRLGRYRDRRGQLITDDKLLSASAEELKDAVVLHEEGRQKTDTRHPEGLSHWLAKSLKKEPQSA